MKYQGTPTRQRGEGMGKLILLLIVIGFVVTVVLKLLPFYMENMSIMRSVNQLAMMPEVAAMSNHEIKRELLNKLNLNDVRDISDENFDQHFTINKTAEGKEIQVAYNREAKFAVNVYILTKFTASAPLK